MAKKLSLEDTKYYLEQWKAYNNGEAAERLVDSNKALIKYFAKRFLGKGVDFDDLEAAGLEALWRAINKFDYVNRPIEGFSTYISTAIENAMKGEIRKSRKHNCVISINQPIGNSKDGDELKIEDIIGTDEEQLLDDVINEMKIDIVKDALKCLTSRERQIILLRYGLDEAHSKTQEELAEIFGCTKTTISNQEKKALVKMRHPRNTRKLKDFIE